MSEARAIDVLNGLLAATRNSPLAHLADSAMFFSSAGADEAEAIQAMIADENAHAAALAELMIELGESPRPMPLDAQTAGLHYLDVQFLLPKLLQAKEALLAVYASARASLAGSPRALEVVSRLEGRQRAHAARLRELSARVASLVSPAG